MKELGHLQVYDLILKTRTPLFVGSGKKYVKKEEKKKMMSIYLIRVNV